MSFKYNRVLLVGATSGIGASMAEKFIREGAKVIAVGRRQERLDAFVQKHGPDKASGVRYDITDSAGLDAFVDGIVSKYPDLDCVFLNAGTQTPILLSKPAEVDLDAFHREISTNFSRPMDLSIKFLPHLLAKPFPTALLFTGSLLAAVPVIKAPAYATSKAALTAYVSCLRQVHKGSNTKIIEIWPPLVQSEIHDYMGPEKGRKMGMPTDEFTEQAWAQLAAGSEMVIVGSLGPPKEFHEMLRLRNGIFDTMANGRWGP
ncbi:uncharacterized protein B0H64DRAFT_4568 [Chaetomium fimeti]|uniref:NAD(P)-binding protein n=1 Tax=Chaetomium fimeti TaxID=1854472 RepID=A0AAE0HQN2_9PEZI|nr:hypothetical protein B0H64DRAFT_4568 [Chaetomium fimeti]